MSVKIDLKIFLFAIIFYFTKQIKIYALLMILALVHELGHLVCGICLGLKLKSIKIMLNNEKSQKRSMIKLP